MIQTSDSPHRTSPNALYVGDDVLVSIPQQTTLEYKRFRKEPVQHVVAAMSVRGVIAGLDGNTVCVRDISGHIHQVSWNQVSQLAAE